MKNRSKINVITGLAYQVINTGLGFVLPYLFIVNLGSEANGLLNSCGQIFACLSLLEAGVGAATVQALYKPVHDGNQDGINGILSATNAYYKKTGFIYTVCVLILCIVYPFLFDSQLTATTIRAVIFLQGAGAVVNYYFQAKYMCLLQAEGKNYIHNCLLLAESFARNIGKIVAISLGFGLIVVQAIHFLTLTFEVFFVTLYIRKKYCALNLSVTPNYTAIEQKDSVMIQSIAWMVFNHTDILVLTVFSRNLTLVSIYSVYVLVFEAVQNLTNTLRNSFQYKIGNLAQKSIEGLTGYYRKYSQIITSISCCFLMIAYWLCDPFVKLYTAKADDANYMLAMLPEMFVIYKVLYTNRAMIRQIIEAAGHFRKTEGIAIKEALINLIVSIALVPKLNIYGVLIGTIVSLVYSIAAYTVYTGNAVLNGQARFLFWVLLLNFVPIILSMIVHHFFPIEATSYMSFIYISVLVFFIAFAIYAIVYLLGIKLEK